MLKLRRMHLDSIGSNSARFSNLTLDFTDTDQNPLDTIVWLRNGGGKTSLLSLFFSLFLPRRTEFLGARDDRKTLGDYVLTGDTAHIVCEWETPSSSLVTGAVYEWPERHRPVDHESHAGDLNRRWYAFTPKPEVLAFDRLPVRDEVGRRRNLEAFGRELRTLGKTHPLTGLVITHNPPEWNRALLDRGIDPAVFRYQKEMNRGEGAIDEQFRFSSGESFVNFLITMAVDAEPSESVATRMRQLADKLARRPAIETELEYCEGVAERLGPIAATWRALERSRRDLERTTVDARQLAAGMRGTLQVADEVEHIAEGLRAKAATRRTTAETARTTAREKAREYYRRSVEFWVCDATDRVGEIEHARGEVEADQAGWLALEDLLAVEHAEAEVAEIDRRLAAKASAAEPLRVARNEAARRVHWRYTTHITDARAQHAAALAEVEEKTREATGYGEAATAATREAGRHEEQVRTRRDQLNGIDAHVTAAREAGHLVADEDAPAGLERTVRGSDDVASQLVRLDAQMAEGTQRQNALVTERTALGAEITEITVARDAEADAHRRLSEEVAVLGTDERIRELAQSDHIALWGAAPMLDGRLNEEIERADAERVAEEVQAGRDRRNREALGEGGLLPPSEDTEAICTLLAEAGVPAVPGLAYLASSVARRDWDATISAHPGLLSGVLVDAGDLERARRVVIEAGLHPASLVAVAKKSDLRAGGEDTFVVPPSPALYDKEQADAQRGELDGRLADLDRRTSLLVTRREADRQLRDRLRRFIEACPHGHLETVARHIEEHELTLAHLVDRQAVLEAEAEDLATMLAGSTGRRGELAEKQLALREQVSVLRPIAQEWATRPGLVDALAEAEGAFTTANELAAASAAAAEAARRKAERRHTDAVMLSGRIERLAEQLELIRLQGEGTWEPVVDSPGVTTEALVEGLRTRDEEYWGKVADSVLEDRRRRGIEDRAKAQSALAERGDEALRRAGELRVGPDALDAELRDRRALELAERRDVLLAEHGGAAADLLAAEKSQREITPSDRKVYRELAVEELPVDRADAEGRRVEADAESQRQQAAVTEAEREITDAIARRDGAKTRKELVAVLADALETLLPDERDVDDLGEIDPFEGSDDDARRVQGEVAGALKAASTHFSETDRRLGAFVGELRQYATRAEYEAAGSLREAIMAGEVADVGRRAGELASQHKTRAAVLRNDLLAIAADQEILVTDLAGQVRRVLDLLKKAPTTSQMHRSLGEWGGKSFLTIGFDDVTEQPDELARRVSAEVDLIVSQGKVPDGIDTLKKAVHAAVPAGFKVSVLKPNADLRAERVPVSAMAKWSGGEKLTAAVVLYCIVARLRARNRSRELFANSSGALVLDNPLGKASYVGFLAMQRRVAEALGVQLLYTTAVRDLKAVGTFPNVIRCRNYTPPGSDRGFVAAADRAGEAHRTSIEGLVSAARVVRLETGQDDAEPLLACDNAAEGDGTSERDVVA